MSIDSNVEQLLAESEEELSRLEWSGTFSDYLSMVIKDPSISRLSHKLVYDAIMANGVSELSLIHI